MHAETIEERLPIDLSDVVFVHAHGTRACIPIIPNEIRRFSDGSQLEVRRVNTASRDAPATDFRFTVSAGTTEKLHGHVRVFTDNEAVLKDIVTVASKEWGAMLSGRWLVDLITALAHNGRATVEVLHEGVKFRNRESEERYLHARRSRR